MLQTLTSSAVRERASTLAERRPALLLVEDNRADATLVRFLIKDSPRGETFEISHTTSVVDAIRQLRHGRCDCALLDLGLPDAEGLESVRRLRAEAPSLPLVVLTGHDDESLGIEALHSGAQDYLVKGQVDGRLLTRAVFFAIERARMEANRSVWGTAGSMDRRLPFDMSF